MYTGEVTYPGLRARGGKPLLPNAIQSIQPPSLVALRVYYLLHLRGLIELSSTSLVQSEVI